MDKLDELDKQLLEGTMLGNSTQIPESIANGADATDSLIIAASGPDDFVNVECLEVLLNQGANVDATDSSGYTALMKASQLGHVNCVELLLSRGADVTVVTTTDRQTALHIAAESGKIECIELLLKYGSNVDGVTASGRTALVDAAARGDGALVEFLLKKGARVHFEEALQRAIDGGHTATELILRSHLKGKMKTIKGKKRKGLFKKVSLLVVVATIVVAVTKRLH